MPALPDDATVASLMEQIEAEQARLRELLAGKDEALLATRPPDGKWSVLENVRHLLFAEQAHLGRFVPDGREWSRFALPHSNAQTQAWFRKFADLPPPTMAEVLDAWAEVTVRTRQVTGQDSEKLREALDGNLRHLRTHIRTVERTLRAHAAEKGSSRPLTRARSQEEHR